MSAEERLTLRREQRRAQAAGRRRHRLWRLAALLVFLGLGAVVLGVTLPQGGRAVGVRATRSPATRKLGEQASAVQLQVSAPYLLPAPVQRELALVQGGKIIIAGGLDGAGHSSNSVYALTPATGHLTALGRFPQAFHDAAGAVLGGQLFVFGGGPETGTSTVQSFDLASGIGRVVSHLPRALSDLSAAVVGGKVFLVGGFDGVAPQRTIYATSDGISFQRVGRLPVGLRYPAVASVDGAVLIAGGTSRAGPVSTVYRFDPVGGKVTLLGRLPSPLAHAAAFALGHEVFVAGGLDASGAALRSVSAINPSSGRVRALAPLPGPVADAAVVRLGDSAWLIGGWNGRTISAVVRARVAGSTKAAVRASPRAAAAVRGSSRSDVYAATAAGNFSSAVAGVPERVYVPNSRSGTVDVIDPKTFRLIGHFRVGRYPQHITPAWDLRHLYVNNTASNSLTVINPRSGRPTGTIPVRDPYNLYFTPDGSSAIVVAESIQRLDFRDPHTWALQASVPIPAAGPNHLDFSRDGSYLLISNEFSGHVVKVDLKAMRASGKLFVGGSPVDVKLAPDGSVFFVANQRLGGVSVINPQTMRQIAFIRTGAGAHGMAISRDARRVYVSNRRGGSISVLDPARRRLITTWHVGGSPDMIQITPNGRRLWVSNRFSRTISIIDTTSGRLIHTIAVGDSPHGLTYFPQPGRFSLGHNGVYR